MALRKKAAEPKTTKTHDAANSIFQRQTYRADGKPAKYEYAPGGKERIRDNIAKNKAKAAKDAKNPVKKVIKEAKKILPKKEVSEHFAEHERRTQYASTPIKDKKGKLKGFKRGQSRADFVKAEKERGRVPAARLETKKGWGRKAPVKKKMIP